MNSSARLCALNLRLHCAYIRNNKVNSIQSFTSFDTGHYKLTVNIQDCRLPVDTGTEKAIHCDDPWPALLHAHGGPESCLPPQVAERRVAAWAVRLCP